MRALSPALPSRPWIPGAPVLRGRLGVLVLALLAMLALAAAAPAGARAAIVITSGPAPDEVTEHDLAAFTFVVTPDEQPDEDDEDDDPGKGNGKDKKVRFECRLDAGGWSRCESPVVYAGLAEGRHRFEVRRRKKPRTEVARAWTVRKPAPPKPPVPPVPPVPPTPPVPDVVVPPPPAGGSGTPIVVPPLGDRTPPTVTISSDARMTGTSAEFRFAADEPVAGYECSLGDAPFTPCTSPLTARVEESGSYVLRVRATDLAGNRGAAAVAAWTVVRASSSGAVSRIEAAPPPAGAAGSQSGPVLLTPFPLVRLVGLVYQRAVKVSLLSVRAPVGARISISCRGRTCPLRRSAQTVAAKGRRTVQTVTFGRLRNKRLGAGTVLEVRVTKAGRIGKYVRFTFRSGKAPKRSDLCLAPGRSTPSSCPSS